MRKLFVFIFALVSFYAQSQTSCASAQPFCAGGSSGITFPASTGTGNSPTGPDYGCLYTTPNAAWYYLQVGQSGSLDVLIEGQLANGNAGYDVDFICWGPFSSLAGACNSLTAGNTVDCSYSGSYTETLNIPSGVTGQYYMVLITNFSDSIQNIIFDQQSGTGNTDCTILSASSPTICAGSSATIVASNTQSLTSPNYSINPGGNSNSTGSFVVSPLTTTHYTLYVTGFNSQNATVTQTVTSVVSVYSQPIFAPTYTQVSCTNTVNAANMHLTFNPTSPAPSYTLTWSGSNPSVTSPTQSAATGLGAGPYTVTAKAAGGCSAIAFFTMDQQPAPAVFTLTPLGSHYSVTCSQSITVLLTTNPAYNYTFTNGSSLPIEDTEAAISYSNAGNYTVTGQNPASGCISTNTFAVIINTVAPHVTVTPNYQTISCNIAPTTVTASTTGSIAAPANISIVYHFDTPLTTTIPGTIGLVQPPHGNHTVCAVDVTNGCSSCTEFTVQSNDVFPSIGVSSAENFTIGCGQGYNVAHVTISNTGTTGATYTVLTGSGPYVSPTLTYSFTAAGNYTAVGQDVNNGCKTQIPFSIISNTTPPHVFISTDPTPSVILTCSNPTAVISAAATETHVAFTWSWPGSGVPQSVNSASVNVTTAPATPSLINLATYSLIVENLDNGCLSSPTVALLQNLFPPIVVISGNTPITCDLQTVNLNNASHSGVTAAGATHGFSTVGPVGVVQWLGPQPQAPGNFVTYTAAVTGAPYTLTVIDQSNGCTNSGTVVLVDNRIYPIAATYSITPPSGPGSSSVAVQLQPNQPIALSCGSVVTTLSVAPTNFTSTSGFRAVWSPAGTNSVGFSHPVNTPGKYSVVLTNTLTGCSTTKDFSVAPGALDADFTPDQTTGYAPLTVNFTNNSHTSTGDNTSILTAWSFGNGSSLTTTTTASQTTTYTQPGTYTVTIFASKGAGCQDTAMRIISVDIPSQMEIPNVFTPNGDNVNDIFFLKSSNLTDIHATIYDRWGHKVYELTSSTGNIAWDGKNDATGKDAAAGTYFYIIKATGKDGQTYDTKGTVSLYR